ncbi:MAG: efflux RND transporter periplasmic adaptor subunit [Chloroflexi bacterium]|nr:efflux RND transporter periplasmic adaptor subunit [Chloroflexota bacterium]
MRSLKATQYLALVAMLGVTSGAGYYGYQRYYPKPVVAAQVNAVDVAMGNLTASVTATGSVASPAQSKLAFKSGGRLSELKVTVGDPVKSGQVLARLDDADLQMALAQARGSMTSATIKLEQLRAGPRAEDVRASEASVESAKLRLEQVRAYEAGPEFTIVKSQLEQARLKLEQLEGGTRSEDLDAARAQGESARARLAQLRSPRADDLDAARAQVASAQARLAQVRQPRAEDISNVQIQLQTQLTRLEQVRNPRPEDIRNAEAAVTSAQVRLQAVVKPRAEDIATAQGSLDQQQTRLAQILDAPKAKPEDIANAVLQVQSAQVNLERARASQATASSRSSTITQAEADASVQSAQIALQTQQNNLAKLQGQGPTDWEVRLQQQAVAQAQTSLDKLRNPSASDVQTAQIAVDQAQTSLEKLRNPSPYDITVAEQSVAQAQLALDKLRTPAETDLLAAQQTVIQAETAVQKLLSPSDADLLAAQQSVIQAETSLEKLVNPTPYDLQTQRQAYAQAVMSLDRGLTSNKFDIRNAEVSLRQAQAQLDLKLAGSTIWDIQSAEQSVEQAKLGVIQAETNLSNAILTAPFDGVVSVTAGNIGEQVGSGTPTVTLTDTRVLRIDVVVDETDVGKIKPGQASTVTLESMTGMRFPGKVIVVAPTATVQQGVVNYLVQVQLDLGNTVSIRPGMSATAQVVIASRENVVIVPNRAIKLVQRNRTVTVQLPEGKTDVRTIQVGLANDQQTEVTGGLVAGERVIIPSTTVASIGAPGGGGPGGGGRPGGGFPGGRD